MKKLWLSFTFLLIIHISFSQERKLITLEDIWLKGTFRPEYMQAFQWLSDNYYTTIKDNMIISYDLLSGKETDIVFADVNPNFSIDNYSIHTDGTKILIVTETEQIYRHSFKAIYYVFDVPTKKLLKISPQKISYATLSPDGKKIAYVSCNNLYYCSIDDQQTIQVTSNGKVNYIINGSADWVYEEEFSFTRGFFWSSDSKKLAYYSFDESQVREYNMQVWNDLYPSDYRYKYPKAGEKNSTVSIHCYFLENKKTQQVETGEGKDIYFPRIKWANHPDLLSIQRLNRLQNHFEIIHANVSSGEKSVVYEEKNSSYVEITDDLTYLKDGKYFVITSEKNGYRHLYRYDMKGKLVNQITKGNWEMDKFLGIDEKTQHIYYTSTEVSPLERHLYSIQSSGKNKKKITSLKGTNDIEMSPGYKYFVNTYSTLNEIPRMILQETATGKTLKTLLTNESLRKKMEEYQLSPATFFQYDVFPEGSEIMKTAPGATLNAYMIKPLNMDPAKKYPVLIFVYGGPGSQNVTDGWKGSNYFWFQMLAQQGYIVVSIDNRGTGGRGAGFKKITQNQLGRYETEDVIQTSKYLSTLPFIDGQRIGIFGWSYGGYLASLAMTLGADYFKAGIAVAPVISWRFYDTVYTERYLGLPQENAKGYDQYSPINHAEKLKGKYLLVHGTADDNVHIQNSLAMQDALIDANKQFEAFYYPDRNHGIYGGTTRYHLYKMMSQFIFDNL
ncbi:MAG: S9 family peptidase [Cytophagaceae bacterium]|nr:S9 family peptidase [Cytophagaceae bacterium]